MMHRLLVLILCGAIASCSAATKAPAPTSIPQFETSNPNGNARLLARLVKQLCIENGDDRAHFLRAVEATGWKFQHIQKMDPNEPLSLDVLKSPNAQVLFGELVSYKIMICNVAVSNEATEESSLIVELSKIAGSDPTANGWHWHHNSREFVMDFSEGSELGTETGINVDIWH